MGGSQGQHEHHHPQCQHHLHHCDRGSCDNLYPPPIPHNNHLHHDMPGIHPLLQEKVYLKQPVSGIFFVAAESDPYVDTGCFFSHWYSPKNLKYEKPRLGESMLT